ncbi:MAG: PorT family protein, partial [Ferruginibacter sp.]|nr:PorT family protein [Ferruginibacter sp.]
MKKVILSAAVIIAAISVHAQNKFGLQAGGAFSTYNVEAPGFEQKSDSKFGFTIGALADVDFGNSVSFRPELNFIQKGGELKTTTNFPGGNLRSQNETTLSYIQLSPNFVYNFKAGTGKLFIGVGPELALGIGGKNESENV